MLKVKDLMTCDFELVETADSLNLANSLMALGRFHHLPVFQAGKLVGILSCRDICRSRTSKVRSSLSAEQETVAYEDVRVDEMMTPLPETIGPEAPAREAAARLRSGSIGCLPVVSEGVLVGMLTVRDFLDAFIRSGFMDSQNSRSILRGDRESFIPWAD